MISIYKSQGSGYDEVYIYLTHDYYNQYNEETQYGVGLLNEIYTNFTRAKTKIMILTDNKSSLQQVGWNFGVNKSIYT